MPLHLCKWQFLLSMCARSTFLLDCPENMKRILHNFLKILKKYTLSSTYIVICIIMLQIFSDMSTPRNITNIVIIMHVRLYIYICVCVCIYMCVYIYSLRFLLVCTVEFTFVLLRGTHKGDRV